MDWNDPHRALPEAPQEGQEYEEAFREVRSSSALLVKE